MRIQQVQSLREYYKDVVVDLFICSASFEERCLSVARQLPGNLRSVLIAENICFVDKLAANREIIHGLFPGKTKTLAINSDDPISSADSTVNAIGSMIDVSINRIVIDISTFTHEALLVLYKVGQVSFPANAKVEFVYSTAGQYEGPENRWLSKGVKEIRSIVGFPGQILPSRRNHLIILHGFEDYRALAVIEAFQPAKLSVGYGDNSEPSAIPHSDTNIDRVRRLRSLVGDMDTFKFSCFDPNKTFLKLNELIESTPGMNHIIAPMNTKISAIGTARTASRLSDVQLCYAQPEFYNFDTYSTPGNEFYVIEFDDYFPPVTF